MKKLLLSSLWYCLFLCLLIAYAPTMLLVAATTIAKKVPIKKAVTKKASQKKPVVVLPAPTIIVHIHNSVPADKTGTKSNVPVGAASSAQPGLSDGGSSDSKKDAEIGGAVGTVAGAVATGLVVGVGKIRDKYKADSAKDEKIREWADNLDNKKIILKTKDLLKKEYIAEEAGKQQNPTETRKLEIIDEELKKRPEMKTSVDELRDEVRIQMEAKSDVYKALAADEEAIQARIDLINAQARLEEEMQAVKVAQQRQESLNQDIDQENLISDERVAPPIEE